MTNWFQIANVGDIPSPALLVYPARVEENIRRMIALAGGVGRLRPHMKTHKMPEVIRMQVEQGITRFKCATIAEAEVTAAAGAEDVLLAYQPVGPNVERVIQLAQAFPKTKFSVIADGADAIWALSTAAQAAGLGSARGPRAGARPEGLGGAPKPPRLQRLLSTSPEKHLRVGDRRQTRPARRRTPHVGRVRSSVVLPARPVPDRFAADTPPKA
jgi:hypothetical protein